MDQFFKIEHAKEKIQQLNIKIRQLVMYMEDEKGFLMGRERDIACKNAQLALQIRHHGLERGWYKELHWRRLTAMTNREGFMGTLSLGEGKLLMHRSPGSVTMLCNNREAELSGEEEEDESEAGKALETILLLSVDNTIT